MMNVRAAALMTTALFVVPLALADVVPPKPADVPTAAPAAMPQPAAPVAPATAPATAPVPAPAGAPAVAPTGEASAAGDAVPAAAEPAKELSPQEVVANSLVQRDGTHELAGGKARIAVAEGFAFLDAADTKKLLTDVWGNPPQVSSDALGAIVPKGVSYFANESWAAVVTYEDEGYIADDDAQSIDYTQMMKEMKEGQDEVNAERKKAGYEEIALVGWAQEPKYNKGEHKLYWAKHLKFGKEDPGTLNYAIRALGRSGVLQVNVIGGMNQLQDINGKVPGMLSMVSFTDGNRYTDYKEGDKLAAYGIAGLIAGGVAAKAGLFKLLLGAWKLIAVGVVALGALAWRMLGGIFSRKSDGETS
jgi:uncharacterized membrane-anchored protein